MVQSENMNESNLPNHVVLIPDGNRRWAKAKSLVVTEGHRKGIDKFWENSEFLFKEGVPFVSIWAASIDNLKKRSKLEVSFLVSLAKKNLADPKLINSFIENKIKVKVVGKWKEILEDVDLDKTVADLERQTEKFSNRTLTILFGYDGLTEMEETIKQFRDSKEDINSQNIKKSLWTGFLPEVDLVIRTGGEPHWSAGFMMWLTANSQFYFSDLLWPDFGAVEVQEALIDYAGRARRLGK